MEKKINALKQRLKNIGTRDLLGMIGLHFITFFNNGSDFAEQADIFNKTELMSPQKQYTYLAGLLMSTNDESEGMKLDEDISTYNELEQNVQEITMEYITNFLEINDKTPFDAIQKNLVTMEAFTSYFDTGILRYPEQTINLIKTLYKEFDTEFEELTGLKIDDFIDFYKLICDVFEEAMNEPANVIKNQMKMLNPYHVDVEKSYQQFISFAKSEGCINFQDAMNNINCIKATTVIERFGKEKGNNLLDIFGLHRKERNFMYYNGKNPFAEKPLCWVDEGETLFIVHPQFVLNAMYDYITNILENQENHFSDKYKKIKADTVETCFLDLLKNIFGDQASYHTNVCEERGTKEHDILLEYKNYILLIEVKASKVREPFFNPQKGYIRVKDHFNSDSGIGGAYKQAIVLKKFIENQNDVILYENKNNEFKINGTSQKTMLPIVFTLNQFGGLAVNTSMILEKEEDQPYPWVCNLHDFENLIEILKYLHKSPDDFLEYICWRSNVHRKVLSSDELDVAEGYFLNNKIKNSINKKEIFFSPIGPSLIDKIYFQKHGIPYDFPGSNIPIKKSVKIGRNEPCPCGSGKKFKKCCIDKKIYN